VDSEQVAVREAQRGDVEAIVGLIRDLAAYERAPDSVEATVEDLDRALFGSDPKVFAYVADLDGVVVGTAIYFLSFSTWTGQHGLYLEDIFVVPEQRSRRVGRALMTALAGRAVELGCRRVEWAVLNWNEPAIGFYRSLGAEAMDEWTTYRLAGSALADLADLGDVADLGGPG
jgi:GNAT superfamily N-acetyltransferase